VLESNLRDTMLGPADVLFGVSDENAEVTLQRLKSSIVWLEGYSAADLAGNEAICVLSEESGLGLGEEAALILRHAAAGSSLEKDESRMIARFKVVGLYGIPMGGNFTDAAVAYCPLEAMRRTPGSDARFKFAIRSFSFALRDSRDVSAFKDTLVGLSLDRSKSVRAAVDDRILQGTVAPIQKNIALLRGVQALLFALVTGMGFLLCFLLARARKPEFAVMRMLGQSPLSLMLGALAEQVALCALGLGIGVLLALLISGSASITDWRIPALIAACYLAGAATAALLGAHGKPMLLLKGRE
jgi:ABC-type lipoprotein release transport system permease subunit